MRLFLFIFLFIGSLGGLPLTVTLRADEGAQETAPASEKPASEKPASEKPASEKPASEESASEESASEKPASEESAAEESASEESGAEESGEWVPLFDGESIDDWNQRGGRADFAVVDKTIVGTTRQGTPNSFLCTPKDYADFILEYEFKVDPQLNSGVQIRSQSRADYKDGRVHGYQIEIDPSERAWTGGIYDEGRRGWLFTLENRPEARAAFKQDQWNQIRVEARGDSIRTWVNGVPAADLKDDMTSSGFIALQVHSTKSAEPLQVSWRNLRIKSL